MKRFQGGLSQDLFRQKLGLTAARLPLWLPWAAKSGPKWLRLSEAAVGPLRILEHGRDARFLVTRKATRGKRFLGGPLPLRAPRALPPPPPAGRPPPPPPVAGPGRRRRQRRTPPHQNAPEST